MADGENFSNVRRQPVTSAIARQSSHYQCLDFLRGIAALAVVLYHFSERMDLPILFSHGYLAVDFFFVLSGFVLTSAYWRRLCDGKVTARFFYRLRIIRLSPLVVLGTLISFVVELGRPGIIDHALHIKEAVIALVLGSVIIPTPFVSTLQNTLFPLDGPVWSLFFEAIANGFMPLYARMPAKRFVVAGTIISCGILLGWAALNSGTVHVGFRLVDSPFGIARVGFSFAVGAALFSVRDRAPQVPFSVPVVLLTFYLAAPPLGNWDLLFQMGGVYLILPTIVFLASGARCGSAGRKIAKLSGDLSYPLYALHFPIVRLVTVISARKMMSAEARTLTALMASVVCIAIAAVAYKFYDAPVRKRLSARFSARGLFKALKQP